MSETKQTKGRKKAKETVEVEVSQEVVEKKKPSNKKIAEIRSTRRSFRELRKILTRDSEVLIMNNTQGMFYYYCPKTHMDIKLEKFGDTEIVTMEVLEGMKNRGKAIFQNYCLIILDVYPELDEDVDVEDVLLYLGIKDLYDPINYQLEKNGETYSEEFFDKLILEENIDDFKKIVEKMNRGLTRQLARRGFVLFSDGEFDSNTKMAIIQDKLGVEDLFATV